MVAELRDPVLTIGQVEGDDRHRLAIVTYTLELEPSDHLVDRPVDERVRLHAVDEHDAAVRPESRPIAVRHHSYPGRAGSTARRVEMVVTRDALDVQRDWWSSGPGGETRPIAEWPDHIAADVVLSRCGRVVASVTTPTVTGSWGLLANGAGSAPT